MTVIEVKHSSIHRKISQAALLLATVVVLVACKAPPVHHAAPIVERGVEIRKTAPVAQPKKSVATSSYVVQKGDTMYSIAFLNGVDYREVAELNNIENPGAIQIGQQLRIPLPTPSKVAEVKPAAPKAVTPPGGLKTYPKAGKIPYSPTALALAEKMQEEGGEQKEAAPVAVAKTEPKADTEPAKDAKDADEEDLEWSMPSSGKVIAGFSESDNRKGVDIAGKQGQAVVASASGKVVYSGSGLRGYGKLVIIKHNKTFLSAYAHNDQILVKEGQSVSKGQKIAEMGKTDTDQVKLHFEIRKLGKPVDPAQYLPLIKS
jgi:lipoprotein NlpD